MPIEIKIDSTAIFKLPGERKFLLDLYVFNDEFVSAMFAQKGKVVDGKEPVMTMKDVIDEVTKYVLEQTGVALRPYEAEAMFENRFENWEKVAKNWQSPIAASPTSPVSMDPRFAD